MILEKVAALEIKRLELGVLKPHPRNPRTHPKVDSPAWAALSSSLDHDYFDPLVVNTRNGMLVSGHLRHKVLLANGFTHADVSIVDYDEPTHIARLIAANQLLGKWEEELLANLAADLNTYALDPGLAGWTEKELATLVAGPTLQDDSNVVENILSKAEEVAARWQVQLGDLYQAGNQRILCGDCTNPANLRRLLDDRQADMVWTDPPYNVDYASTQKHRLKENKSATKPAAILNDDLSPDAYRALLTSSFQNAFDFTKPGGTIYIAHAESYGLLNRQAAAAAGFYIAQCLIWVKSGFTLGRQDYQWQHEPILYGWKPGAGHYWQGGYSQSSVLDEEPNKLEKLGKPELIALIQSLRNARDTTVIREPRGAANALHPTIKPLALVARQIWNSSQRNDTVLELFGGSGTTLIAAQQTGRRGVATELDPTFCAVILERLTQAGLTVEKISHGNSG